MSPGRPGRGPRDERGFVAGAEALLFGTLVLVTGTLVIVAAWGALDLRATLDEGARAYLRTYTEADDPFEAERSARAALDRTLDGAGVDRDGVLVEPPDPARFGPCQPVTVVLRAERPGLRLPFGLEFGTVRLRVRHDELVDPHREMVPGPAHDPEATPCAE